MGSLVSGLLVMATLIFSSMVVFSTLLNTGTTQGITLLEATEDRRAQLATLISITSTSGGDSGGATDITITVDNTGAELVSDFSDMDMLVRYTRPSGSLEIKRLTYVSGAPNNDQWTVTTLAPDSFNPNIWDPDEVATLDLKVSPPVKNGTTARLVVVTPRGVYDSAYFTN